MSAVENSITADLPGNPSAVEVIGNSSQGEMSGAVPTDISDPHIVLLRAKVTKARKDVDDISADVADQVDLIKEKMPQSGVGSMQGKNTGNMPSAVCASSMNKSLDPTPI